MSRPLSTYARPAKLPQEEKERIQGMFDDPDKKVNINFLKETVEVDSVYYNSEGEQRSRVVSISMEALGKMFGIMQQYCITVRKSKKDSKL